MVKIVNKIKKSCKHFLVKTYNSFREKTYISSHNDQLHYILKRHKKSKRLFVVFSAFNGYSERGRYNYLFTLKDNHDNQLFIKDDEGYFNIGTYYLGNKCKWWQNESVIELIKHVKKITGADEIITIGTSKGGTASLLYGIKMNADYIIVGSPQYEISNYLLCLDEKSHNDYGRNALDMILDSNKGFDENGVNMILHNVIIEHRFDGRLFLLYSSCEPSWKREINRMVDLLDSTEMRIQKIDMRFEDHAEIGPCFKKYLLQIIQDFVVNKGDFELSRVE